MSNSKFHRFITHNGMSAHVAFDHEPTAADIQAYKDFMDQSAKDLAMGPTLGLPPQPKDTVVCPTCQGDGKSRTVLLTSLPGQPDKCEACAGKGRVPYNWRKP